MNDNRTTTLKEALQRFVEVYLRGQQPDIDEFVRQYPQHEAQLKKQIHGLREIDSLFDSIFQSEGREFEDEVAGHELVGRKVGSFEIASIIGCGGMGIVYLARDTKLKRSVAIKSMPTTLASDSTARIRFRREAELLASLNHPNIAVIHDIIEQEDRSGYLVLEYVPGETLAERIKHETLTMDEVLSIGRQIAEAISAAHEHGVVHRDLKPSNIKITPEGRIKVLDFGLAKHFTRENRNGESTATHPGRVIGTPAYMSPEQARGKETDHRTDIWSFGCIMFQMLTAHLPFEGETATDTLARVIEREPDWKLLPQNTPANIRTLLRRCLEKDPGHRLGDIAEAIDEITKTQSTPPLTMPFRLRRMAITIGLTVIVVLSCVAVWFVSKQQAQPSSKEIRLVVLPFENLGLPDDEYFANGITDEITTRLADIHGLGVISRQSAMQYKDREKNTQQIAEELGVDYILVGTVQRERPSDPNSQVRIRPRLIKASDDTHVWAQVYDEQTSEVFRLQSDVAERVAQVLDITLLEPELRALASRPTENMEAYDYYLRGNDYFHRAFYYTSDVRIAIRMYEKAVELDPMFALAHAELSRVHAWFWHVERSEENLAMAKQAVDKAFELNPNLPEAHLALGDYYYRGHSDYDRALEQFAIARKSQPNNSQLLSDISFVQRRQGKFEQALANLERASELNPHPTQIYHLALTFMLMRRYAEAERYYDRAISLAPDMSWAYSEEKAWLYLCWNGSTEKARAVLEEALSNIKLAEDAKIVNLLVDIDVFDGNYQEALERLSLKSKDINSPFKFIPNALRYARIYGHMSKNELAKRYYDEARSILETKIQENPEDARFHSSLGIAYAGLDRKEDALQEGRLGVKLLPVTKDAWTGTHRVEDLARIYVMVGEHDLATEQLEYLLSIPGEMSIPLLRLDPAWDPLRDHPRFQKLLESAK